MTVCIMLHGELEGTVLYQIDEDHDPKDRC